MSVRVICALGLFTLLAGNVLAEERFLIEVELWLQGEKHGEPIMVVTAGEEASISRTDEAGEEGWRLTVEVERPGRQEGAPFGALWLHVGVHQLLDGTWEHLADSILGVPEGQAATLSVVEGEVERPGPENSIVFLTARTSRVLQSDIP